MSYSSAAYLNPQAVYKQNAVETAPPAVADYALFRAVKFLLQGQKDLAEKI